ncbi:YlaI family protein [Alkalicoccus urumqiensis]|uniref:DUF2197 domain-containing protein n=1 Tax=Alkalicoccus urumqiensis TaxID=1548213 RepID=A0A2P6MET0_ALKUR|nr:YlaI family protein [Alkalicoccus urumqiensis]PRO64760.1 DUF2197 domain-containing protein [Alkalicoccus urumqiensis]
MRVKCVLCDKIESIDSDRPLAKKLRNRPIHTYMCEECSKRISDRTRERHDNGMTFNQQGREEKDDYI